MIRLFHTSLVIGFAFVLSGSPAMGQDVTADDYIQLWKPLVGAWKMTTDVYGEPRVGTFDFQLAPNEKCFLIYHGAEGVPFTQQLEGYDPVIKKHVAFGFCEDGVFQIQTISVEGMRKGLKAAKGIGGDWEAKRFSPDGKLTTLTSKWRFAEFTDNKIVMFWSDVKRDGKPVGETTMTLERQK